MTEASDQLDRRLAPVAALLGSALLRPPRGWIKAVREALGMTTSQMAHRLGVAQPRISEIERTEIEGKITLQSLERAANALGCQLVYVLVPREPLSKMINARADAVARDRLHHVDQSMRLEDQRVIDPQVLANHKQSIVDGLLREPARLWDER